VSETTMNSTQLGHHISEFCSIVYSSRILHSALLFVCHYFVVKLFSYNRCLL